MKDIRRAELVEGLRQAAADLEHTRDYWASVIDAPTLASSQNALIGLLREAATFIESTE